MSWFNRQRYRKRLNKLLSRVDDEGFCQLVWAVDALQSDRERLARPLLSYPQEAITTDQTSPYFAHRWKLETLVNELLTIPKEPLRPGPNRRIDHSQYSALAQINNALNALENAESALAIDGANVLDELPRMPIARSIGKEG